MSPSWEANMEAHLGPVPCPPPPPPALTLVLFNHFETFNYLFIHFLKHLDRASASRGQMHTAKTRAEDVFRRAKALSAPRAP